MGSLTLTVVLLLHLGQCAALSVPRSTGNNSARSEFVPVGLVVGNAPSLETTTSGGVTSFSLNGENSTATLDYGTERAGYPFFSVTSVSTPVQIEVKYSEAFIALDQPWSDGPYTFQPSLSNGFRVETFTVSTPGRFTSRLIQGGQRWETIRLLTPGTGNITFSRAGLEATVDTADLADLPGTFQSSDTGLNEIWTLGAKSVSVACLEKGSQGPVWEVDSEKGAFFGSVRPSGSLLGMDFENYTLQFDTLIDRGGLWWSVALPIGGVSGGINLMLVSELPEESTFVNTNQTITPANSIVLGYGFGFVNLTSLTSYYLDAFPVPFNVTEQTWHHLTTVLSPDGSISVSLDQQPVFNVSLADYYTGGSTVSSFSGSFGFGGWQDQSAYVRNVTVTDTADGSTLYTNAMTSDDSILAEYGTQANLASVCLDGPKRDRLVWLGDFYSTSRLLTVSTGRHDLARGTLQFLLGGQAEDGELNINPLMSYDPTVLAVGVESYALYDYQFLGLDGLYSYVQATDDLAFVASTWGQWQKDVSYILSTINETDGLVYLDSAFLNAIPGAPAPASSAVSCLGVQTLDKMAAIAGAINDTASHRTWSQAAAALKDSINSQLWNDKLGVYGLSTSDMSDFSTAAIGLCITSGVANVSRAARSLRAVQVGLKLWPGYVDSTQSDMTSADTNISPFTNGFLLDALLVVASGETGGDNNNSSNSGTSAVAAEAAGMGSDLLQSLWATMASNQSTASGASWEYVSQTGTPGLGYFTSLSHPWGGAATYVLTERALGLRPADGADGFGYKNWVLGPEAGVQMGLTSANGTVQTPYGVLAVSWRLDGGVLRGNVSAPVGTKGKIVYRGKTVELQGKTLYDLRV